MSKSSKTELNIQKTEKFRNVLVTLPPFCIEFFRGIEPRTSLLTRINYAYDLRLFFSFLENELGLDMHNFGAKNLQKITMTELERYLEYLALYYKNDSAVENGEKGIARKLSSIRSIYKYFYKKGVIDTNITEKLETPKIHEKPIIRLSNNEASSLLNIIESGSGLSDKQLAFHEKTKTRDIAVFILFLTTGIRISELCALDCSDVNLENNEFKVLRKGGNEMILYFGEETKSALNSYIEERKIHGSYFLDSPMFLSLQNRRMSVRALQHLVKKYARLAVPLKNISPHKLRSTYGTMLYEETGDIYLVADVLGHKDINTTRKHYAAIDEERRKLASGAVKIRDK
jgi:integrase/recombinase XerC